MLCFVPRAALAANPPRLTTVIVERLPAPLIAMQWLGLTLWQWLGLVLLASSAWLLGRLAAFVASAMLGRILRRTAAAWDDALLLGFMDVVERAGTCFAFPTRTVHLVEAKAPEASNGERPPARDIPRHRYAPG